MASRCTLCDFQEKYLYYSGADVVSIRVDECEQCGFRPTHVHEKDTVLEQMDPEELNGMSKPLFKAGRS